MIIMFEQGPGASRALHMATATFHAFSMSSSNAKLPINLHNNRVSWRKALAVDGGRRGQGGGGEMCARISGNNHINNH